MNMNDDKLFAKLSEAFEELYGSSDFEDPSASSSFDKEPLDPFGDDAFDNLDNTIILNDEKTLQVVFNIFREKFKGEYNFED